MRIKILRLSLILLALILITILMWMAVAGSGTVMRVLRYGDTKIDDYTHYPGRALQPSSSPNAIPHAAEELAIPRAAYAEFGQDFDAFLEAMDTIAFLVVQDGALVYVRYLHGHTADSISQIFSVTKSFTSALIGLAIEDGLIEGVEQPVTDFVPELAAQGFDIVTLHHLLTMTSGSDYQENDNPFGEHVIFNFTPQLEAEILDLGMETEPGTVYHYKSGDNALLGLILARILTPETITEYTQRRLWAPLGMEDPGIWTIDHEETGLEKTWCCLAISARDLAKFGVLYLNDGAYAGKQLFSSDWVEESTQQMHIPDEVWPQDYQNIGWRNYGYQWWLAEIGGEDYFGLGKDGQFLYINPETNTVIVRLGWSTGDLRSSQWVTLFQTIAQASGGE